MYRTFSKTRLPYERKKVTLVLHNAKKKNLNLPACVLFAAEIDDQHLFPEALKHILWIFASGFLSSLCDQTMQITYTSSQKFGHVPK